MFFKYNNNNNNNNIKDNKKNIFINFKDKVKLINNDNNILIIN
jgi:hypothetical protein